MAQTRTITRKKLAAFRFLDIASRSLHLAWRPQPPTFTIPRSFLIVEPWGIGDVILVTPLLEVLREKFPGAQLILLAKEHASALLAHSGLVDDVIAFDFPWTSFAQKYRPSRYERGAFESLFGELRKRDIDVSLDARRDIRSNVVTYLAGARRRIGYDFGGGAHLLTDVVPSGNQNAHKIEDWLALLVPLGLTLDPVGRIPSLVVTQAEQAAARDRLEVLGIAANAPILGVHPGASHPVRRWDQRRFAEVLARIQRETNAQVVIFEEREGDTAGIATPLHLPRVRAGLRELMAFISVCDLLFCNDSGPMHIAEALQVPVTALFGGSRSEWYGPRGAYHKVIEVDDMPCRPCFDSCIFSSARCMEGIQPDAVTDIIRAQLAGILPRLARRSVAGEI